MQRIVLLILLMTIVALTGCNGESDPAGKLNSVFGGAAGIETVRNSNAVSAFRLKPSNEHHASVSDYVVTAGPVEVSAAAIRTLRQTLLDVSSYRWDSAKGCIPNYGVRIEFKDGTETVDVLFCFECDILAVYHNNACVGGEDFDDVRKPILMVIKELFADDQEIQSL